MVRPKILGEESLIPDNWNNDKKRKGLYIPPLTKEQKRYIAEKKKKREKLIKEIPYSPKKPLNTLKQNVKKEKKEIIDNRAFIEINGEKIYEGTKKFNEIMGIRIEEEKKPKKFIIKENPKTIQKVIKNKLAKPTLSNGDENIKLAENSNYSEEYYTLIDSNISILAIQEEMFKKGRIKEDEVGIIFGDKTAKYIYENNPSYYLNSDTPSVKKRAENLIKLNEGISRKETMNLFYNKLEGYEGKAITKILKNGDRIKLYARGWKNYRTKKKYLIYGSHKGSLPIKGTAIASSINQNPNKLKGLDKNNNIYILKENNAFCLYYYLGGKLRVASYVSPGDPKHKYSEKKVGVKIGPGVDWNHISGTTSDNNIKIRNGKNTGASMPNTIPIPGTKGEAFHASLGNWIKGKGYIGVNGKLASHGCTRMPPFYSTVLAQYISNLSSTATYIDVQ